MEQFITKTELQKRWSKKLIEAFNPSVAKTKKNVYGGMTMFYSLDEIKKIERRKTFKEAYDKAQSRKQSKEVVEQREQKIMERKIAQFMDKLNIKELPSKDELINDACYHYNTMQDNYSYCATPECDKEFLLRITQNYVRHCLTNYDAILEIYGNGKYKNTAYELMKKKINKKVAQYLKAS